MCSKENVCFLPMSSNYDQRQESAFSGYEV